MLLAEQLAQNPSLRGQAFNFSNELRITVLELARKIIAMMGSTLEPDVRNEASHEIRVQYLDAGKARRLFKWTPLFSLDTGLEATLRWYRTFFSTSEPRTPSHV